MKRILLIGSEGQLGTALVKYLLNYKNFYHLNKKQLDVTIVNNLNFEINKINPEVIINCIAYTNVRRSEKDIVQTELLNVTYIKNLCNVCLLRNIKLIHFSSDYIFDGRNKIAYTEQDNANPLNNYGLSKLNGDLYIENNLNDYIIIRCSWLYSGTNNCFLTKIYANILLNKNFSVDSNSIGNPTFIGDLVDVVIIFLKNLDKGIDFRGTFNFCSNPSTTWYNFALKFYEFLKKNKHTKNEIFISPNSCIEDEIVIRPLNSSLNISKINKALNLKNYLWINSFPQVIKNINHEK